MSSAAAGDLGDEIGGDLGGDLDGDLDGDLVALTAPGVLGGELVIPNQSLVCDLQRFARLRKKGYRGWS